MYKKDDRVELSKDLNNLPQGLKGRVLQSSGLGVTIQFQTVYEIYKLSQEDAREYLRKL